MFILPHLSPGIYIESFDQGNPLCSGQLTPDSDFNDQDLHGLGHFCYFSPDLQFYLFVTFFSFTHNLALLPPRFLFPCLLSEVLSVFRTLFCIHPDRKRPISPLLVPAFQASAIVLINHIHKKDL